MAEELTPYAELAQVIGMLPLLLREARRARGLSQRVAAEQLGLSFSTISRIETGHDCVLSHATAVLRWLDARPAPPALEVTVLSSTDDGVHEALVDAFTNPPPYTAPEANRG